MINDYYVKQRYGHDCVVACVAMLLGWTYEEAFSYFPPRVGKETGANIFFVLCHINDCTGIEFYQYERNIRGKFTIHPKSYPSIWAAKGHATYWNGHRLLDPSSRPIYSIEIGRISNFYTMTCPPSKTISSPLF